MREHWQPDLTFMPLGSRKEPGEREQCGKLFEEAMARNFPNLKKNVKLWIEGIQQTLQRIVLQTPHPDVSQLNFWKLRQTILKAAREKRCITYKSSSDYRFSPETTVLKWNIYKVYERNNCRYRILNPEKNILQEWRQNKDILRTSLVVQWLRLWASTAGGRELKFPMLQGPVKK